jgi:hypothetical protein
MKKWIVYSFLICYLFSTTELSELLKVDHVFTHFKEHQSLSHQLDFSEFIYMHYFGHGDSNGDDEKDKSLPFHSHSESCATNFLIPVVLPNTNFNIEVLAFNGFDTKKHVLYQPIDKPSSYLNSIWQPPQLV